MSFTEAWFCYCQDVTQTLIAAVGFFAGPAPAELLRVVFPQFTQRRTFIHS